MYNIRGYRRQKPAWKAWDCESCLTSLTFLTGPYWVPLGPSGSFWVFLGLSGPLLASLGLIGHYWAFLGLTGPYWPLLNLTGSYWAILSLTRPCRALFCICALTDPLTDITTYWAAFAAKNWMISRVSVSVIGTLVGKHSNFRRWDPALLPSLNINILMNINWRTLVVR